MKYYYSKKKTISIDAYTSMVAARTGIAVKASDMNPVVEESYMNGDTVAEGSAALKKACNS